MNKKILSKHYECTSANDIGSLWAKIDTIRIENKLSIIDSNRTNYTKTHIHSTIHDPQNLNQLLLEIEIYKTETPEVFMHKDQEIECIGIFKHWPKSSTSDEFCYLSLQYKENEFFELIHTLNQAHSNEKMNSYVNIEVLGLNENCIYNPDEDLQNVLLVTSVEFSSTSFNYANQ